MQADAGGAAMFISAVPSMSFISGNMQLNIFVLYFQLKPVSTPAVQAAAAGSASSVATDPVPPLLVPQCSSSSLGSGGNEDGEEKVLAESIDQVTPLPTKRSSKESRDTEEILNLLKVGNEQSKKILEQNDNALSASIPEVKKSWCLWMEASVNKINPFLWRSSPDQCYQMITTTVISLLLSSRVLLGRLATVCLVQHSNRCSHMSGLTGAHCSQGDIPCTVSCFWVSDLDHYDRGPQNCLSIL